MHVCSDEGSFPDHLYPQESRNVGAHVPLASFETSQHPRDIFISFLLPVSLLSLQRYFMSSEAGRSPDSPLKYQFPLGSSGTWSPGTMHTPVVLAADHGGFLGAMEDQNL